MTCTKTVLAFFCISLTDMPVPFYITFRYVVMWCGEVWCRVVWYGVRVRCAWVAMFLARGMGGLQKTIVDPLSDPITRVKDSALLGPPEVP